MRYPSGPSPKLYFVLENPHACRLLDDCELTSFTTPVVFSLYAYNDRLVSARMLRPSDDSVEQQL